MSYDNKRKEFLDILEQNLGEQAYQDYLEKNTRFIPHEFVQNHGIGLSIVLRKLSFGADFKTDFFYFSKSSDDWNAVFIEIEKPISKFFKGSTNKFHGDFISALQQINQWKAWFISEQNKGTFLSTVSAIQVPSHMARNPTYNKYVLVFGRRSEYQNNDDRRRLVKSCETDDFKIITFDSLAEAIERKYDLIVGSRHNQFIDILTDDIIDPGFYAWVEPTQIRVSKALQEKLKQGGSNHHVLNANGKLQEALSYAAPLVQVRP